MGVVANVAGMLKACFEAGTPILVEGGSKVIESLLKGDLVWSRSEHDPDGPLVLKRVLQTFERFALVLKLRVGGKVISTTSEHPFYVAVHGWRNAGELKVGDMVRLAEGWLAVESTESDGSMVSVYNVELEDFHTYFVGGEDWGFAVWVHNAYTNIAMRKAVNTLDEHGYRWYRDPYTNVMKRTRLKLAPDHVLAAERISQLKGFERLSRVQQLELLTDMKNIQALPYRLNSSKGDKLAKEWIVALGKKIHPDYRKSMMRKENQMKKYFSDRIEEMLGQQASSL